MKLAQIMNNQVYFVCNTCYLPNKLQYIHSPEIFISSFSLRFFSQKSLANLNYFTLNERANNFTSDGEKPIAVCYSQHKL